LLPTWPFNIPVRNIGTTIPIFKRKRRGDRDKQCNENHLDVDITSKWRQICDPHWRTIAALVKSNPNLIRMEKLLETNNKYHMKFNTNISQKFLSYHCFNVTKILYDRDNKSSFSLWNSKNSDFTYLTWKTNTHAVPTPNNPVKIK
jgi:DNA-dependent RNA polymerase auxiliary subunit epsilon